MSATEHVPPDTSSVAVLAAAAAKSSTVARALPASLSVSLGAGELAPSRSLSLSLPLLLQEASEVAEPGEEDREVEEANLAVGEGGEPATEVPVFLKWKKKKNKIRVQTSLVSHFKFKC